MCHFWEINPNSYNLHPFKRAKVALIEAFNWKRKGHFLSKNINGLFTIITYL